MGFIPGKILFYWLPAYGAAGLSLQQNRQGKKNVFAKEQQLLL